VTNDETLAVGLPHVDVLALSAVEICGYLQASFDRKFYIERYPDIAPDQVDALEHYTLFGWKEGRDPCAWFSTQRYLADHSDVAGQGINPLLHYVLYGQHEARRVWPAASLPATPANLPPLGGDITELSHAEVCNGLRGAFDAAFYAERYPDMATGMVNPLEHYAFFGWKEGRDPCDWFSTRLYLAHHLDVTRKGVNPLLHYVLYGRQENRRIWPADFRGRFDLEVDRTATFVTDANLRDLIRYPPRALRPPRTRLRPERLVIHWLVPDFSSGSGGHMTIFRLVRWLEVMGHECTIWITTPTQHCDSRDAYDDIIKNFQTIRARVAFAHEGFDQTKGDVVIATGWQTVARAMNATGFRQRCYLVQDYEVSFHPMGSSALVADWTYTQEMACICASPWLSRMLKQKYGRWTRHFFLAYDHEIYFPAPSSRVRTQKHRPSHLRIALYARSGTARRAVELALLALENVAALGLEFHVDLFGEDSMPARSPFPCTCHGILNALQLAELYRSADIGICFSTTNYSLVPQEMMACGLPVVEIDGDSTRAVFPNGVVTFTGPHPLAIAADVATLLNDRPRRRKQAAAALRWVSQFDWEKSARAVERALLERLVTRSSGKAPRPSRSAASRAAVKASVCIPTYDGGDLLLQVVERLRSQRAPWPFEIVIVDSGSTDGSIQRVTTSAALAQPAVLVKQIPQSEFQHGRTRNLCASLALGEFVAFLTQDALPADEFWLYNIVTVLEHFPRAAGAFGCHVAWPTASPFIRRDVGGHFANLTRHPLAVSRDTNVDLWLSGENGWRQFLHYFSDNNSCLRRSVWQCVPYPELEYGEDQVWADIIIKLGYEKVYVPSATVYHSHDYTPAEAAARAATESFFFTTVFGYRAYDTTRSFEEQLADMQHADTRWAHREGVSQHDLALQLSLNEATLSGRTSGLLRAMGAALPETSGHRREPLHHSGPHPQNAPEQ
jgi:glycosyltransferase involved in cell wall biosynthesis